MVARRTLPWYVRLFRRMLVVVGAVGFTFALFLVLPLIQAISATPRPDLAYRAADTSDLPPPPPPQEEPPPEEEPEEEPPELQPDNAPLDLAQLDLLLGPGGPGDGLLGGDFAMNLNAASKGGDVDALFAIAELDQVPRAIHQPMPILTEQIRRKGGGQVYILFVVDQNGRVENPTVQSATDPIFERPALNAVRQWRFEPGKRKGEPVRFRMRVPITFQKS